MKIKFEEKFKEYCRILKQRVNPNNKVLFIKPIEFNVNLFEKEVAKNRGYYCYPPMGAQYLIMALEGRGLETKIFDLNYELLKKINEEDFDPKNWKGIFEDYIKNDDSSVVGISNGYVVEVPYVKSMLKYLRNENRVLLTGAQNATYIGKGLLQEGLCNFVLKREAENKINFLFDNLFESRDTKPTPNILFKYNGEILETEGERDVVKLKGNLINSYKLLPMENYYKYGSLNPFSRMFSKDTPYATLTLSRGCKANCKFCGLCDFMGKGYRNREVKDVLDEMEYLTKKRGIRYFEFLDDDLGGNKDKTMSLLQGIIDKNLGITWASNCGFIARHLDYELMDKLRESKCLGFRTGVESGNPEVLKRIRKPCNLEMFRKFSRMAQGYPEMFIADNYIIGFPGENFGMMKQSYKFSLEMNLDWSCFSVYQHNVSCFGDKEEKEKQNNNEIGHFQPTGDGFKGKLSSSEKIYKGLDIFKINDEIIPSKEQLDQIWITMDFSRNFVHNKNLKLNPKKFLSWTNPVRERYPSHPYINLYLALSNLSIKDYDESKNQYNKMQNNLQDDYWQERFDSLQLTEIANNFPKNPRQAKEIIYYLMNKYGNYL